MSTAEEAAFVSHLAAHPGDRTARLAYADWLEEHGRSLAAAWMREDGTPPPLVPRIEGEGAGKGDGEGDGGANGQGDGYDHGRGFAEGSGYAGDSYDSRGEGDGGGRGLDFGECYGQGIGYGDGQGDSGLSPSTPFEPHTTHEEVHVPAPGEYVIVRSRDQGCVCGEYRSHHGREVVLSKARQIFSWEGQRRAQVDFAVVPRPCQLSREAPGEMVMLEASGITPTTPEVEAFLRAHPGE